MKIDVIAVGKVKEKFFTDAISEYEKRLSRYIKLSIIEVKDEKTPDGASEHEERLIMDREAERICKYLSEDAVIIPLCIEGDMLSSVSFSEMITELENKGCSHLQFIIGGSLGLAETIKKRGRYRISFSKMTFPHQLMRVIVLEQIYRAYRIKNNEPYHK